jgi:hypothetical protein
MKTLPECQVSQATTCKVLLNLALGSIGKENHRIGWNRGSYCRCRQSFGLSSCLQKRMWGSGKDCEAEAIASGGIEVLLAAVNNHLVSSDVCRNACVLTTAVNFECPNLSSLIPNFSFFIFLLEMSMTLIVLASLIPVDQRVIEDKRLASTLLLARDEQDSGRSLA